MRSEADEVQRYDITEQLSAGAMAEVYLARAQGSRGARHVVAFKRVLPLMAGGVELERRFLAEARQARALVHPHIVQVLDFGRDERSLFLVLEHVDGANLAQVLRHAIAEQAPLPLAAIAHVIGSVARALELAHGHGVLHRDVSPANILIARSGDVKLADFALAQAIDHGAGGPIAGNWAYISPEQARGEQPDPRSDVFAAGVVLYELIANRRLFAAPHWESRRAAVLTDPIAPVSEFRTDLPAPLAVVVARALERDPAQRYAGAADFADALDDACRAGGIAADPRALAAAVAPFADGPRRATTSAAALSRHAIIRVGETDLGLARWRIALPAQRARLMWIAIAVVAALAVIALAIAGLR